MRRWVLALAIVATGCGPIAYVNQVTREASTKVDRAKSLNAEVYSPYWWTRATTYLRMAREVAAHADYQGANTFGRLSAEAADKAVEEATAAAADPSKRPVNPAAAPAGEQGLAPAKE